MYSTTVRLYDLYNDRFGRATRSDPSIATAHHDDILVLTANEHFGQTFQPHLESNGNEIRIMFSVSAVVRALESHPAALLLIDRRIPDLRGLLDSEPL